MAQGTCIVADFGKTLSKLSLWSQEGEMLHRHVRANEVCATTDYACLDIEGIGHWLLETLALFSGYPVKAIIPVAHGAAVVALKDGKLVCPPLDYEQALPGTLLSKYQAQRDSFAETGSPALPGGLNFGAQLHWLEMLYPEAMRGATLLPYAQYWAWFLSGKARSEVTCLGCHTDLWNPATADFSTMAKRRGWAKQFAPLARAGDAVGTLLPDIAANTGLSPDVVVHTGLHDSNAALLAARGFPEIAGEEATVLSTGTWFVAMRSPAEPIDLAALPEAQDCLVNVDAFGQPVPSARFMGGREIEALIETDTRRVDIKPDQPALLAAVDEVVDRGTMLLPTFEPGFGPYPNGKGQWINRPDGWYACRAAVCLYAALVADTALGLIGSKNILLVEGRFAGAEVFVRALASLSPQMKVYAVSADNDVSFGALRLLEPALKPASELRRVCPLDQDLAAYKRRWLEAIA